MQIRMILFLFSLTYVLKRSDGVGLRVQGRVGEIPVQVDEVARGLSVAHRLGVRRATHDFFQRLVALLEGRGGGRQTVAESREAQQAQKQRGKDVFGIHW